MIRGSRMGHYVLLSLYCLASTGMSAQVGIVNNTTSTPTWGVGHDYIQALSETVNPQNGSVSVRVGGPVPPSRGITTPQFVFNYDSNLPQGNATSFPAPDPRQIQWGIQVVWQGGSLAGPNSVTSQSIDLTYQVPNGPFLDCNYYTDYVYTDSLGQRHPLGLSKVPLVSENPSCSQFGVEGSVLSGGDSQYAAQLDQNTGKVYVTDPHGMVITSSTAPTPNSYEDSNGNTGGATHDSMGRTVVSTSGNSATYSGISNPFVYTYGSQSWNYNVNASLVSSFGSCGSSFNANSGSASLVTAITLPNNQQYKFHYGTNHGLLDKITYPSGATITYTWAANPQSEAIGFTNNAYPNSSATAVCQYRYDGFAIVKRVVSFDGTTPALEQDFSYTPTTWNANAGYLTYWISKQTVVTTRDLLRPGQPSYQTIYNYTPVPAQGQPHDFNSFPGQIPIESSIVYYDTNGSILKTVLKTWAASDVLGSQCVMLPNGQTSGTFYTYASGVLPVPTDKKEYDYGQVASGTCTPPSSTPVRETATAYQSFPATPLFPSQPSIFDRPSSVKVYDHGALIAETDYFYDETAVSGLPSVTGHDETNYSASYNNRGNLTTKIVKCLQSGCVDAVTKYTYDETGQVLSTTDPKSNTTTYSYADSYTSGGTPPGTTDGYLTKITYPTVNGVTQTKKFSYDYASGQLNAATDPNSQTTTYTYNDPFRRPTLVNSPDGGQSEIAYNDTAPFPTVTSCQLINGTAGATCSASTPASGWKTSMTKADGMGHAVQTQLASDPDGADFTDTTYDGLARVWTRSNPHRLGSSSTDGTTTYYYDGLGRVCLVVPPDGTQPAGSTCPATRPTGDVLTAYSGNCATVTDEVGNARKSCSDGLGRLTQVFEDPTGLNYETDYAYDALNNLLAVNQKGGASSGSWRNRSFVYDSLSRLTQAANPESGTLTYGYDNNGNVTGKIAPAPNQPQGSTATVTTSYSYDALNRLTKKSYSDGVTSAVQYGYDGVLLQCPDGFNPGGNQLNSNIVGRLNAICNGVSSRMMDYDSMGRIIHDDRSVGTKGWADVKYSYYLNGEPSSLLYPQYDAQHKAPEYELWWDVNGAGNIDVVGTQYHYFLTNGKFTPAGNLMSGNIGGVNLGIATIANTYNKRLQPINMAVSANGSGAALLSKTYDFHLGNGDNGNVFAIANNKDNNRSQNFSYDALNRIQQAYTTGPNWGETFTIDAWGNLTNKGPYSGKTYSELLNAAPASTKNQLTGFNYDAAGNLTYDGNNTYTYDAENRIIQMTGLGGTWSYYYDGEGNRVEKCSGTSCNGSGTIYWRSALDGATLAESDLNVNFQSAYVLLNGEPIGRLDNPSDTPVFYLRDHLGSTSVILNSAANIVKESDYYPYGGEIAISGSDPNHYKFTGKERDSESGLDNFGARYDSSSLGRFMSADPSRLSVFFANPQTWNRYSYVYNSPLRLTDDNGKWPTDIHNQIIDKAFPNLTAAQRQILKNISARQDSILMGGQANSGAYQHAMRRPHQTVEQAEHQFNDFVSGSEASAQTAEWTFVLNDPDSKYGLSLGDEALAEFAEALHAIVDSTSPAHEGFQVWDWRNPSLVIAHMNTEKTINPQQMQNAITAARNAFNSTFGMFGFTIASSPPEPKPHVTHKICYTDDKGKQVCQ